MQNEFWVNLPSKDLERTRKFFTDIGFNMDKVHSNAQMVSMDLGNKKVVVNVFPENMFREFIGGQQVTDAKQSNEVLFSLGANSPEEVDAWAEKAVKAGATLYAKPGYKDGWMYGCGFVDPDGHRWNLLFMDMSKMPKG
ncbi:VOC family protein [uncultured Bdellovibrio sp.]|uniref:VOC family protein n=1 Tax=Bdellovibrio sp. HCB-162 TaxID=3394234 RepID=UPI0025D75998|nr:VOC family protein [uncultured Bdellovibrio sp.]